MKEIHQLKENNKLVNGLLRDYKKLLLKWTLIMMLYLSESRI